MVEIPKKMCYNSDKIISSEVICAMSKGLAIVTFIMGIITGLCGLAVMIFGAVAMSKKGYYYR